MSWTPSAECQSAILPAVTAKPRITIVGAGNLGKALGPALRRAGYQIDLIVARAARRSLAQARGLAKKLGSRAVMTQQAEIKAEVIWLCVPDAQIARVVDSLARVGSWRSRVVLHSSGALTSDELRTLRRRGSAVASVHPLMTFVPEAQPELDRVPFAIEGDARAVQMARRIVTDLGGKPSTIRKQDKVAYHSWSTFISPLLTAFLATTERVAAAAGVSRKAAKERMLPILQQTIANFVALGAADSFSGPLVRGDVEVVKGHLRVLRGTPVARNVYVALARGALAYLPAKNKAALRKILK